MRRAAAAPAARGARSCRRGAGHAQPAPGRRGRPAAGDRGATPRAQGPPPRGRSSSPGSSPDAGVAPGGGGGQWRSRERSCSIRDLHVVLDAAGPADGRWICSGSTFRGCGGPWPASRASRSAGPSARPGWPRPTSRCAQPGVRWIGCWCSRAARPTPARQADLDRALSSAGSSRPRRACSPRSWPRDGPRPSVAGRRARHPGRAGGGRRPARGDGGPRGQEPPERHPRHRGADAGARPGPTGRARQRGHWRTSSARWIACGTLTDDFLDLSSDRPLAGQDLEVTSFLDDAARAGRAATGLDVDVDAPSGLRTVQGDGGRLRQVLLNLVTNAARAGARPGPAPRGRSGSADPAGRHRRWAGNSRGHPPAALRALRHHPRGRQRTGAGGESPHRRAPRRQPGAPARAGPGATFRIELPRVQVRGGRLMGDILVVDDEPKLGKARRRDARAGRTLTSSGSGAGKEALAAPWGTSRWTWW